MRLHRRTRSLNDLADTVFVTGYALADFFHRARHRYFALEPSDVLERLKRSMVPFQNGQIDEDLTDALRSSPDLFGLTVAPVVATTMMLLSPLSRGEWIVAAWYACCAALFTIVLVAVAHAAVTRAAGPAAGNWLQFACLMGYSLAPHALASVLLAALAPAPAFAAAALAAAALCLSLIHI